MKQTVTWTLTLETQHDYSLFDDLGKQHIREQILKEVSSSVVGASVAINDRVEQQ